MPDALFPYFIYLHVLAAIIAFGPAFSFPLIGAMGGKEPMHANFATRVSQALANRRLIPFALTMPLTGIGAIWSGGIDPFSSHFRWLLIAIALYVIAVGHGILVQGPAVRRVIALTSGPGAPGQEIGPAVRKVQQGGIFSALMIMTILALMVIKPGVTG